MVFLEIRREPGLSSLVMMGMFFKFSYYLRDVRTLV